MTESYGKLDPFLRTVIEVNGTDLLLTTDHVPLVRYEGTLRPVESLGVIDEALMAEILSSVLVGEQRQEFIDERDIDFALSFEDSRFRGNAFFQRGLPAIALRLIHNVIPSFDEIGLPYSIRDLAKLHQGLILFTGPTGSGKSTSMATLVDAINADASVSHHHDRGPDRVPAPGQDRRWCTSVRSGSMPRRSTAPCAARCVRTPTSCSSARCATPRASRSR